MSEEIELVRVKKPQADWKKFVHEVLTNYDHKKQLIWGWVLLFYKRRNCFQTPCNFSGAACRRSFRRLAVVLMPPMCCYVSVYFLLFCVGFQLVTQFNKK